MQKLNSWSPTRPALSINTENLSTAKTSELSERYPGAFDYATDPEWTTPKGVGYDMFHLINPMPGDSELEEHKAAIKRFPVLVAFPAPLRTYRYDPFADQSLPPTSWCPLEERREMLILVASEVPVVSDDNGLRFRTTEDAEAAQVLIDREWPALRSAFRASVPRLLKRYHD